ncbi:glycosyl hydrolase family 18 protein [Bacillus vallismortis]|uniref:Glycosyl hydrolase family 18 protein n=1 Tax=Bacillus vallismortis TaxID=72361 RepID=A0AAP3CG47_BACVA|nr:glycosyl hydrolase family 18 protein [Bacillus vallismortis]MCY8315928.1 glycosyl hydrolase family 18 protein [Bacillus vallismortis]
MKKWLIAAVSLAIAIILFMYSNAEAKAAGMTLGYTTGDTASYNSLVKYHTYMNSIATDTFAFEKNGQIIGDAPSKQLTYEKKKNIKANKVIMGIPAYGYDWDKEDESGSAMREWNELKTLINKQKAKPIFNKTSGSMMFSYVDKKKHKHVVWYENEKTVQTKSHLAKRYKIAGVSVYALGNESESFWKAIRKGTK